MHMRVVPSTRENGGPVSNRPDRPGLSLIPVTNPEAAKIVGPYTEVSPSPIKTIRGKVIGGGMSEKTIREKRRLAANGS